MNDNTNNKNIGHLHPISLAINKLSEIFSKMGFDTVYGPELEDEWYNFDSLNVPKHHPSRDMQDTFWIKDKEMKLETGEIRKYLLRTHTSNMQIRTMMDKANELTKRINNGEDQNEVEKKIFPIAICCPGKAFRNEATDSTHEAQFHQVEGLYINEDANISQMLGVMKRMFSEYFDKDLNIRLRSSFFPFVEPGNEFDIQCFKCDGKGCSLCKSTGWIEIGGCGMVHPNVLKACNIDNNKYRGWAFGCGIDRMIMLKYGIDDIRLLYNGDLRLVGQF